jgi:hypothetical protein
METNSDDNFISDDNIIDEYINKLYNYISYSTDTDIIQFIIQMRLIIKIIFIV